MNDVRTKHPPQFFLSLYGWTYWFPILVAGLVGMGLFLIIPGMWWMSVVVGVVVFPWLAFFRDFHRVVPADPASSVGKGGLSIMVAPADGKVTEISRVEHYGPLNGPALKIGIFLSVLDVHVNRAPCDGVVLWTRYEEGLFLDARHTECSKKNQSNTICIGSIEGGVPIVVVKQIVGAIARRIIAPITPGERFVRGQRIGMIAFGSRTELYVPASANWQPAITLGTHVKGGKVVLLQRK